MSCTELGIWQLLSHSTLLCKLAFSIWASLVFLLLHFVSFNSRCGFLSFNLWLGFDSVKSIYDYCIAVPLFYLLCKTLLTNPSNRCKKVNSIKYLTPKKIQNGKSQIKWQNQKLKYNKRMVNNCHILDLVQVFSYVKWCNKELFCLHMYFYSNWTWLHNSKSCRGFIYLWLNFDFENEINLSYGLKGSGQNSRQIETTMVIEENIEYGKNCWLLNELFEVFKRTEGVGFSLNKAPNVWSLIISDAKVEQNIGKRSNDE